MIDTVTIDGSEIPNNYWGCIKPLMGLNLPKHGLFEFKDSRTFENLQVRHYITSYLSLLLLVVSEIPAG